MVVDAGSCRRYTMNTQLEAKDRESGHGQHDTYMNTDIQYH
jgi:hypothetical protein